MATNTRPSPPNTPNPVELLSKLLDKGYTQATAQVIRSIARDTEVGPLAERLKAFDQHAAELAEKGEPLKPDDPYLRALLADFGDALKKDAVLIDAAGPDVQGLGIDAAGQFVRQTSLPGFSDAMLQGIGVQWNTPDPEAVNAAVGYVTSDAWKAELKQFSTDPVDQAQAIAIRGIVAGQGPLTTARDLRAYIENYPAYRANSLMRTTQLESYRQATAIHQDANRDILLVQIRMAALDDRTCLCCIALHGTEVPIGEPIIDHDSGRCFSVTKVKGRLGEVITQRYIGDDVALFQTGEEWFNSLPEERQKAIAGFGALDALKKGEVQLKDFVQPYQSPIFGDMVRQASLKTALSTPNRTVQTINGMMMADRGKPGDSTESLNAFISNSNGPLSAALRSDEMNLLELDFFTDEYTVHTDNVKTAARRFVQESQNIQYSREYLVSIAQHEAARNNVTAESKTAERLYNQAYASQAQAILDAARIGNVKLTEAQMRRLQTAAGGDYLDMVYTTASSERGSLANQTKRAVVYGGNAYATDAARKAARREFLDRMGRLDES